MFLIHREDGSTGRAQGALSEGGGGLPIRAGKTGLGGGIYRPRSIIIVGYYG